MRGSPKWDGGGGREPRQAVARSDPISTPPWEEDEEARGTGAEGAIRSHRQDLGTGGLLRPYSFSVP